MKKVRLFLLGVATLFLTACTVGVSSNKNSVIKDTDSITNLTVTFDFNGGTYDSKTTTTLDVKPTSYWKYVQGRLDEAKVTPPTHTTFKGFSFAKDNPGIIDDSYVIKEDITVYAQYEPNDPHCVVEWLDEEGSTPLAIENYFLNETPEFKGTLPYHEDKSFGGWDPEIQPITKTDLGTTRQYTAIWVDKKYKVTWLDYDGTVIRADEIEEGGVPIKPSDPKGKSSPFIEYTFDNWAPAVSEEVHNDQIYVATYKAAHIYGNTKAYMHINIVENNKDFAFSCVATSNITVDWGDGTPQEERDPTSEISHTYENTGEFNIRIFNPITSISVSGQTPPPDSALIEELYLGEDVTSIGNYAFRNCSQLQTITFADESELASIGNYAFEDCSSLIGITIPSGVTGIEQSAFRGCSQLKTITFAGGSELTSIGNHAFYKCSSLTNITIPSGVTSIGNDAFNKCSKLQTVTFAGESKLTSIDASVFHACSALTSITIPSGVTLINQSAFYGCSQLKTITFADESELASIGNHAFEDCSSLIGITIPSGVTGIGLSTFEGCKQLQTVTFGEGSQLTSIGNYAFNKCSSLTNITIPSGVTSIGERAFQLCEQLQIVDLTALNTPPTLGGYAFVYCHGNLQIYVKVGLVETFKAADGWKDYATKIVPGPVPSINVI